MLDLLIALIGVGLAIDNIISLTRKSSKPLYRVPRLIIAALLADILIISMIYLLIDQDDILTSAIYLSALTVGNMILMISGSSVVGYFVSSEINNLRIGIMFSLAGVAFAFGISLIVAAQQGSVPLYDYFSTAVSFCILYGLILWSIFGFLDLRKEFYRDDQIRSLGIPWVRILILIVALMVPFVLIAILFGAEINMMIIGLNVIFLAVLSWFLHRRDRLVFINPSKYNLLLITDINGNLKYSYNFSFIPVTDTREGLLAGWIVGVSNVLSEFFDRDAKPKEIKLDDYRIYVNWSNYFNIAIITDHQSHLYKEALDKLAREIQTHFGLQVELMFTNSRYLDLSDVVLNSFDFIK